MADFIQEKVKMNAKDFFLHIASMVALYAAAIALLTLLFQAIDAAFPDQLYQYYDYYSSGIRFAIATLIIVFPLFLVLSYVIARGYKVEPLKRELGIRKWLTFLTLFVAGAVVIGDLIALLNKFLGGEITSRFAYKVLAVLVVSGMVFGYYLYDLRRKEGGGKRKLFAITASVVIVASLGWGFFVMGSPVTQRNLRFDERRVQDLQNIQYQIVEYWRSKGSLPESTLLLNDSIRGYSVPTDPQTKTEYPYTQDGRRSFTLCAEFSLVSAQNRTGASYAYEPLGNDNWEHKAGRQCFERTIDPERYPLYNNTTTPKPLY